MNLKSQSYRLKSMAVAFMMMSVQQSGAFANDSVADLKALALEIQPANGEASDTKTREAATKFAVELQNLDFSPAKDVSVKIDAATEVAGNLLRSNVVRNLDLEEANDASLLTVISFVERLLDEIDSGWVFEPNVAGVVQPAELLKRFKNDQQKTLRRSLRAILGQGLSLAAKRDGKGWTKKEIVARFGQDPGKKKVIEEQFKEIDILIR